MASLVRSAALQALRRQVPQNHVLSKLNPSNFRTQSVASCILPHKFYATRFIPPSMLRVAGFHTSGPRSILPAGPQVIDGTGNHSKKNVQSRVMAHTEGLLANDPAPVPQPSPTHGSYHWAFERLISAALVPLTIAPFAVGTLNPITDAILCATILIHSHIGFQSIIIDYIPAKRLPKTRALFWWGLRAATLTVAVGLYEFETNDVGLTEAVKRIWMA